MKTTFLVPTASDARCKRRINAFKKMGSNIDILAFEREFYKSRIDSDDFISLGRIQHGKYLKRFFPFLRALPKIRRVIKDSDIIYAFELDMTLLGWLASIGLKKNKRLVYEVADIREILLKKTFFANIIKCIQKFLLKKIDLMVVTSMAYIKGYFENILGIFNVNYVVIENKPNLTENKINVQCKLQDSSQPITIGYFGVLRCKRSWEILKEVTLEAQGKVHLYVRGYPMKPKTIPQEASTMNNIEYGGTYLVPDDLEKMYDSVDLVWVCYPFQGTDIGNWQWARTNRFYESCLFKKPMITQTGTEDNRIAQKWGVSLEIDMNHPEDAVEKILNIDLVSINQMYNDMEVIPNSIYTISNEYRILFKSLGF